MKPFDRDKFEKEFRENYVENNDWWDRLHPSYKRSGNVKYISKNKPKYYISSKGNKFDF